MTDVNHHGLEPRRDDGSRAIVVYDGHCPMCRRQVRMIRRFDWLGRLGDLPYDTAVTRYDGVARGVLGDGMRVRFPDGSANVGIDSIRSIMIRTPLGLMPGLTLWIPPVRWLGARIYARIAARRQTAACDEGCAIDGRDNADIES